MNRPRNSNPDLNPDRNQPLDLSASPAVSATHSQQNNFSSELSGGARAIVVNRTHRVVRERAQVLQSRRSRVRSLWIPMTLCAAFVVILCSAIWSLLDQYDLAPTGIPDASSQIFIVLLWFVPVSAAMLALAFAHRGSEEDHNRALTDQESAR